jgi:hypothetical protein
MTALPQDILHCIGNTFFSALAQHRASQWLPHPAAVRSTLMPLPSRSTSAGLTVVLDTARLPGPSLPPAAKKTRSDGFCPKGQPGGCRRWARDVKDVNIDSTSSVPIRRDHVSVFHARNAASIQAGLLLADGLIDFLTHSHCSVTEGR